MTLMGPESKYYLDGYWNGQKQNRELLVEAVGLLRAMKYVNTFVCMKAQNTETCKCSCPNCVREAFLAKPEIQAIGVNHERD